MSKRTEVICDNIDVILGLKNGPVRDVDTGRYSDKPYRFMPDDLDFDIDFSDLRDL